MSQAAIGVVIVFLAVGLALGWYSQKTTAAHSDVKVAKTRLHGGRRTRWRSAVVVVLLGLVTLLAVKDVLLPR
jgi:H+/Cl- antiporter ClcA